MHGRSLTCCLAVVALATAGCAAARTAPLAGRTPHPRATPASVAPAGPGRARGAAAPPPSVPPPDGRAARPGARPVLADIRDAETFAASYAVTGDVVVRYLGIDHHVAPPPDARSTWESLIATAWVRGQTPFGQLGFSLGFAATDFRALDHLILYAPASRDAGHPSDGYVDLPLDVPLPWLSAVGTTFSSPTVDGRWDVSVRWSSPRALVVGIVPRPGADTPDYFRSGTLTVGLDGPDAAPWRSLSLRLDMRAPHGRLTGDLVARPA